MSNPFNAQHNVRAMGRRINFKILRIFIILNIFFQNVYAQSKHTSIWCIGNYIIDFSKSPVLFEKHNDVIGNYLYVDFNGKIQLILGDDDVLYNGNKEPVKNMKFIVDDNSFFVPSPLDNNLVYFFSGNQYILIDIKKNEIVSEVKSLNELSVEKKLISFNHILVHHANCKDVWIIYYSNDIVYKYLITASCVEFKEVIHIEREISNPQKHYDMIIHLSSDCKHYTANFFADSIVCYGDFDRQTGNFVRKSEKIIHARHGIERTYILNSIISHDNKKIYYFCESGTKDHKTLTEVLSSDIINGKPNYENIRVIYSIDYNRIPLFVSDMFYGYDGNIYINYFPLKKMYKIVSTSDGETSVEDFFTFKSEQGVRSQDFLADWFSKNPCNENQPCSEIKFPKIIENN